MYCMYMYRCIGTYILYIFFDQISKQPLYKDQKLLDKSIEKRNFGSNRWIERINFFNWTEEPAQNYKIKIKPVEKHFPCHALN